MLIAFLLSILIGTPAAGDTITLRTDAWCPYSCDPDSEYPGILYEIAEAAFTGEGYEVDYKLSSWARSIAQVRTGKADVLLGAYRQDVPDFVFHDRPAATSTMQFWTLPDSDWTYTGLESLEGLEIGLIKDYSYGDEVDPYFKANPDQLQETVGKDPLVSLVRRLERGRVDVVIDDSWVMAYFLKSHPDMPRLRMAGGVEGESVYIPLSPAKVARSKELARIIDAGIEKLEKSGGLARIYERYGVK
jgi:polar amino acid transport system substrate-binding protein